MKRSRTEKIRSLGLCLGASTISAVCLEAERSPGPGASCLSQNPRITGFLTLPHEGDPRRTLLSAFKQVGNSFDRIASTGRRFHELLNLSTIPEPEAVEYAYGFVKYPDISSPAIVSAGGETFMVYVLNQAGRISNVSTGNKCASGTGEFFLQQLRRMNVSMEEAAGWAASEEPHNVSGRCSVFCKSDCTHATNKGVPKSKVASGLCKMMANKILELLKKVKRENIMITGGTTRNRMMIEYLQREIPGLIVPKEAPYFEALGAALWALEHETLPLSGTDALFKNESVSFETLLPLKDFENMVEFKTMSEGEIKAGDICTFGLDVGSTTTKAVLLRNRDNAILESVYLRTNGDPVGASKKCYEHIMKEVEKKAPLSGIIIEGLGVCGSGRQIAGLHALTDGIINEIIAHAAAAVYFDPKVDTIFEIGGQDAKYTYITNSVPSDYAMNEACSAGTGSFLEESAHETLGIRMEDIAGVALRGSKPPNFNDQCAAFIASDIKNAIHEGLKHEDIVAGLVYSICMNYSNRVKGNRPVGEKVFMQGGVCYNRAVPLAMAALVGKPIVVPPEPGLMGAFGAALVVKERIETGLMQKKRFDLKALAGREVRYGKAFTCKGEKNECDRRCNIAVIELENKKYPFGGACNRYYNLRHNIKSDADKLDLVHVRQKLVFDKYVASHLTPINGTIFSTPLRGKKTQEIISHLLNGSKKELKGRIGINKTFLVNTYYPLYSTFFHEIGFEPVVSKAPSQEGMDQKNAAFCYPVEQAHGFFWSLISGDDVPEFIFLPHFKAVPVTNGYRSSQVCPLVQGETFYLQTTFRKRLEEVRRKGVKILAPLIDLTKGIESAKEPLLETAKSMGTPRKAAEKAFIAAAEAQKNCFNEMKLIGNEALKELEKDPEKFGVVIFARPYNGFVEEAHMGIPRKFASRGISVLPFDFLDFDNEESKRHMYWGMGQLLLKAGKMVERHPQLFGTYITNFSCGPDSFLIGYFRDLMGRKPSLTLELDSHTADAGLETRIEAFIDIVNSYRQLVAQKKIAGRKRRFIPAKVALENGVLRVITSSDNVLPVTDPCVKLLLPSMGRLTTESFAAVLGGKGYNVVAHPPADKAVLKLGRANTSCKECLPLILTTGTLLNYINNGKSKGEVLIYFMPTSSGPCRFGQYHIFMEDLIARLGIPDVAMLSLTSENSYGGMGNDFHKRSWWGIVVSDVMEDIRSMLLTNALDRDSAIDLFEKEWRLILRELEKGDFNSFGKKLKEGAEKFKALPMKLPPDEVPKISLVGEIFVRRDSISRQNLTEKLADMGFATVCSPVAEWLHYCDYLVDKKLVDARMSGREKLTFAFKKKIMRKYEKSIKKILSLSGLVHAESVNAESIVKTAMPYISPNLTGEAVLIVGSSIAEIVSHACGVIAIGPFGCMPNRLSEAILTEVMNREGKLAAGPANRRLRAVLSDADNLPFLAIESDGSPFPQVITAKLDAFCLQAKRLHSAMMRH
ncbi:MAG: acyl-CoA dehydratase activase [Desulfobacterales bacterium]|nr:acyl-CoA dehydratase activase [Desulfobacterales bacterium]